MSNWISVDHGLPKKKGIKYLVFDNNGQSSAYFDTTGDGEPFWYDDYEINNEKVKYWRLLPVDPNTEINNRIESMYNDLEIMILEIANNPLNPTIGEEYRGKRAIFLNEIKALLTNN